MDGTRNFVRIEFVGGSRDGESMPLAADQLGPPLRFPLRLPCSVITNREPSPEIDQPRILYEEYRRQRGPYHYGYVTIAFEALRDQPNVVAAHATRWLRPVYYVLT